MNNIMNFFGLSIIIPAVSETKSLEETVSIIADSCNREDVSEIIIAYADFGTQACRVTAEKLCALSIGIPVKLYVQKGAFEAAIKDLTDTVTGSHFIYQPADMEENPCVLKRVIELAKANPSAIVAGSRLISGGSLNENSALKKIARQPYRYIANFIYGRDLGDSTLLYKCIPTAAARDVSLTSVSYSVLYEMFLKLVRRGCEIVEFPVEQGRRKEGKSSVRVVRDGCRFVFAMLKCRFCT